MSKPTAERVRELLVYAPDTGVFTWRIQSRKALPVGSIAGSVISGYRLIGINRRQYGEHRLAWVYMTGEWPPAHVDHIDRNPLNNAWANLRLATIAQNAQNTSTTSKYGSGVRGVTWHAGATKWVARIVVNYRQIYLGLFVSLDDAKHAYAEAKKKYHTFGAPL